jgi:hypothetical protein
MQKRFACSVAKLQRIPVADQLPKHLPLVELIEICSILRVKQARKLVPICEQSGRNKTRGTWRL